MDEINYNQKLKHFTYSSIEQFRSVIENVKNKTYFVGLDALDGEPVFDTSRKLPTLKAVGTTKLHGTNASIALHLKDNVVTFQSKEQILTPINDNYGFAGYMASKQKDIVNMLLTNIDLTNTLDKPDYIIIFGEWCGKGIQKNVAINNLPKMFVIFDVRFYNIENDKYTWLSQELIKNIKIPELNIHNIYDFKTWELDIDFNDLETAQSKLETITLEIEEECPVASKLGEKGIGEGAVWKIVNEGYNDSGFWMKVKGEKHSVRKSKVLAPIDIEKINSIREFVENFVTDNRCLQSITKLKESGIKKITRTNLGDFIKWIYNDIVKEELDTILSNGFEVKELGSPIANFAREWFFKNENDL